MPASPSTTNPMKNGPSAAAAGVLSTSGPSQNPRGDRSAVRDARRASHQLTSQSGRPITTTLTSTATSSSEIAFANTSSCTWTYHDSHQLTNATDSTSTSPTP